ncbi:MAG: hypothetical protein ACOC9X_03665 [bacterium]
MRSLRTVSIHIFNLLLLAAAIIFVVGCTPEAASEPAAAAGDGEPAADLNTPGSDATAGEDPIEDAPAETATARFRGVRFDYASELAQSVDSEHGQASAGDVQVQEPEHIRFLFEDYAVAGALHRPTLTVFPAASFKQLSPVAGERVARLQSLLAEKPEIEAGVGEGLPILPVLPASETFRAKVDYVSFEGGEGIRFLAHYSQGMTAVNNQELVYVFQGLSADGRYYVSALFPVTHPDLPSAPEPLPRHFAENYDEYRAEVATLLADADVASFLPDLTVLDALVGSLSLADVELAAEPVTAAEAPAGDGPAMRAGNEAVTFRYDRSLADSVVVKTEPAIEPDDQRPPWAVAPEHILFRLEQYPLSDAFHSPRVFVYPAEEYAALSEQAAQEIRHLQQLVKTRTASIQEPLPFLPVLNAQQMLQVKFTYVDFDGGAGIRYLTQYGQAVTPVNNTELFYTFQGLTDDGETYIAAIFPVAHPDLPEDASGAPQGLSGQLEFEDYLDEVTLLLQQAEDESFTPSLRLLDQLVLSLHVREPVR